MVQRPILAALIAAALAGAGCAPHHPPTEKSEVDDVEAWRAKRYDNLKKEGGWLSLAGLAWLHDGANAAGSDPASDVPFPAGAPAKVGTFTLAAGKVSFTPAAGVASAVSGKSLTGETALATDQDGDAEPTKVTLGSLTFYAIWRNGRTGVRITDAAAPARTAFAGIEHWPVDPKWRIEATWQPYDPPHHVEVPTVIPGLTEKYPVPGVAIFQVGGVECRLEPVIEPGETDYFWIFADGTTGHETYGAGRFLYSSPAKDGKVVLDFNKAYNPPCAFTPFATCPLPPESNRLPVRIESGEKKYGHGH